MENIRVNAGHVQAENGVLIPERPILFNTPMVQAILAGRKNQTRRVIGPQPQYVKHWKTTMISHPDLSGEFGTHVFGDCMAKLGKCPYGKPGERLWVRERWADLRGKGFDVDVSYGADTLKGSDGDAARIAYGIRWTPSIHMPRWASRLNLEITYLRCEMLSQISEEDAKAEGFASAKAFLDGGWALEASRKHGDPWLWVVSFRVLP
jgi:hypothetical protein